MKRTLKRVCFSFIAPTLVFALSAPVQADSQIDGIAAVVNDNIILNSELNERMNEKARELASQNIAVDDTKALQEKVLDALILEKLQIERAEKLGLNATDEEINEQMGKIAEQNKMTLMELRNRLNSEMPEGFQQVRQKIKNKILIQKAREVDVISQTQVTESELKNYLKRKALADSSIEIKLSHILIALPESPTPQQREEALKTINDVHARIQKGEDFSELAVAYSQGNTALSGGDLGWLKQEQIPTFFIDAVEALKVGQVSAVIQSASGFNLIKLTDKRDLNSQLVNEYHLHRFIILSDNAQQDNVPPQILKLSQEIHSVADFNQLSKTYADIPKEVNAGSDLGWKKAEEIPDEIRDAVLSLTVNNALPPVATNNGWMILYLEDVRSQDQNATDKNKQAIQEIRMRKANETFDLWLRRLKDEAFIQIN